jgi:glycosyltransferase involved in cell wall biosynthesis
LALAPDYTERHKEILRGWGALPLDYPLDRTGVNPLRDGITLYALYLLFRRHRPDVVLGYHTKPALYAPFAASLAGVTKRIAWIGGLGYAFAAARITWKGRILRWTVLAWYRLAFRVTHQVWFQNPDDREALVTLGVVDPNRCVIVGGTGVDLNEWPAQPPFTQPLTFTLVARLLQEKGVREFVEAARQIKREHPNVRFLLIGSVDTNPGAIPEGEVRAWVREGLIEWVPWTDEVQTYLKQTSVCVLPSYYREGVPRSAQEALAMARPVITTDMPGCRETVIPGVNGFLVPPRNVSALAEAMLRFVRNPDLVAPMGEASRRLAEERFDVCKINAHLLQLLFAGPLEREEAFVQRA